MYNVCYWLNPTPCAGILDHLSTEALTIECTNETNYVEDVETQTKSFLSEVLSNKKKKKKEGMNCF